MENNINTTHNKPMPKWLIYSLFILKFIIGLVLIYWTIYMTMQSDVGADEDNAFLSTYHNVDRDMNKMIIGNNLFNSKYNIKFQFNDEEIIGLTYNDVYLSQRVIAKRTIRKNILKVGDNSFTIDIQDKNGNTIKNKLIEILVTKTTNHLEDVKLSFKNEDRKDFQIKSIGYWNITGTVEVNGDIGTFYIKTNAHNRK